MLTFSLWVGPDGFDIPENFVASDNTFGDTDGILDFDFANLDPDLTYTLCEEQVPAGYSTFWQVYNESTGEWDTVVPYNPNADDDPPEDLGNKCIEIGAGSSDPYLPLTAGGAAPST